MEHKRRNDLSLMSPTELAIHKAMAELEMIGADPKLTEATIHLQEALNIVSDWLDAKEQKAQANDSQPQNPPPPHP